MATNPSTIRDQSVPVVPESAPPASPLLDVNAIGPAVFGDSSPSVRSIRSLTKRGILPHFKIGKFVRYDPRLVRAALELQCLIKAKKIRA